MANTRTLDPVKKQIALAVSSLINEMIEERLDIMPGTDDTIHAVECSDIAPLETMVRVTPKVGMPRYFLVKVSEQL